MDTNFIDKLKTNKSLFDENKALYIDDPLLENAALKENNVFSPLISKAIIEISGPDARTFLNSQLTTDITKNINNQVAISGYCNPKGRLLSIFYIFERENIFYIYTLANNTESIINKLNFYKLRANCEIKILEGLIIGSHEVNKSMHDNKHSDKNLIEFIIGSLNYHLITKTMHINYFIENFTCIGELTWAQLEYRNNQVFINDHFCEQFTPQMISLDKMNGVSFDKGCYPGQEIVARTHYLGESSKELYSFRLKNNYVDEKKEIGLLDITNYNDKNYSIISISRENSSTLSGFLVKRKKYDECIHIHDEKVYEIKGI